MSNSKFGNPCGMWFNPVTKNVTDHHWKHVGELRAKELAKEGDGEHWKVCYPPIRPGTKKTWRSFESLVFFVPKNDTDGNVTRTPSGKEKEFKTYRAKIIKIGPDCFFRLLKPTKHGANEWFKVLSQKLKNFIDDSMRMLPQENPRTPQEMNCISTPSESNRLSLHKHPTPWTRSGKPRR